MAIDFEGLTPTQCIDCPVLQGAILRRRTFMHQIARIVEGCLDDGEYGAATALRKMGEAEAQVITQLSSFVARCTLANEVIEAVRCRVPPSEWHDIA